MHLHKDANDIVLLSASCHGIQKFANSPGVLQLTKEKIPIKLIFSQ